MTDFAFRRISGHTYSLSLCQLVAVEQYAMRPSAKLHDEATMLCPRAATTCHPLVLTLLASAVVQQVFHIVSATAGVNVFNAATARMQQVSIACHQYSHRLVVLQFVTCASKDFTSLHECGD